MRAFSLVVLALLAVGCTQAEPAASATTNDLVGHVAGAGLDSAYAKPSATYLRARRIDLLETVQAMTDAQAKLASRLDGIIATSPADGAFGIDELLQIEKPGFIETLFPAEKAELPALWALLETTNAEPLTLALTPPVTVSAVDASVKDAKLVEPASLTIASLSSSAQTALARLELTHDSDHDPLTVTRADLDAAIAAPGPYRPAEIQAFEATGEEFVARAGTTLAAIVDVTAPFSRSSPLTTFGASGGLSLTETLAYAEGRQGAGFVGTYSVSITATHEWGPSLTLRPDQSAILHVEETGEELVAGAGAISLSGGKVTVEIWSAGHREGSWRLDTQPAKHVRTATSLSQYVDYAFRADGQSLVRNVASAQRINGYPTAVFTFDREPIPSAGLDVSVLRSLETPMYQFRPGRYALDIEFGSIGLDIYPGGVVKMRWNLSGGVRDAELLQDGNGRVRWEVHFDDLESTVTLDASGRVVAKHRDVDIVDVTLASFKREG